MPMISNPSSTMLTYNVEIPYQSVISLLAPSQRYNMIEEKRGRGVPTLT
jgi:hypothetical protein